MADLHDEESEWDHLNRANWRGLGLTDPIKSVEVGRKFTVLLSAITHFLPG
jgi:hypothetical protein